MINRLRVTSQTKMQTANKQAMTDKLKAAIDSNKAYLALASPLAAQRNDQVADLTRQMNRLIRLALQDFRES